MMLPSTPSLKPPVAAALSIRYSYLSVHHRRH